MKSDRYTIDDVLAAVRRKDVSNEGFDVGEVLFFVQIAYALGMELQPTEWLARFSEIDRVLPPFQRDNGVTIPFWKRDITGVVE